MTDQDRILLKTLVAMAWADGQLDPNECEWIEQVFEHLALPATERESLLDTPHALPSSEEYTAVLPTDDDREFLLKVLLSMASADGNICGEELKMLEEVSNRLGVASDRLQDLRLQAVQ